MAPTTHPIVLASACRYADAHLACSTSFQNHTSVFSFLAIAVFLVSPSPRKAPVLSFARVGQSTCGYTVQARLVWRLCTFKNPCLTRQIKSDSFHSPLICGVRLAKPLPCMRRDNPSPLRLFLPQTTPGCYTFQAAFLVVPVATVPRLLRRRTRGSHALAARLLAHLRCPTNDLLASQSKISVSLFKLRCSLTSRLSHSLRSFRRANARGLAQR